MANVSLWDSFDLRCESVTWIYMLTVGPTGFEFALNFSDELTEIILETKYMEQLGFPVPELARSVALQEEKFTNYQDGIKKCLQRYQACIASLAPAEV